MLHTEVPVPLLSWAPPLFWLKGPSSFPAPGGGVPLHPNQLRESASYRSESFTPAPQKQGGGVPLGREQAPKGEWQVQGAKGRPKEGMLKQAVGIISGVSLEPQLSLLMANIISILQM